MLTLMPHALPAEVLGFWSADQVAAPGDGARLASVRRRAAAEVLVLELAGFRVFRISCAW